MERNGHVHFPCNILNRDSDEWFLAFRPGDIGFVVGRGPGHAANEERCGLDGLEDDVYVESWKATADVNRGYFFGEGSSDFLGREGRWRVVNDPERHVWVL